MKTPASLLPDSPTLTLRLTAALGRDPYERRSVKILRRALPPFMSTFPNEIVTCQLTDGHKRRIFIKYQAGQSHECHGHRGDVPYEAEAYRRVLHSLPNFKPKCLGAHTNPNTGDISLFLEYVYRSVRLSDIVWKRLTRQPRAMTQAASWIGKFHATHKKRIDDLSLSFLKKYDAEYYRGWAQRTFDFSRPLHGRFPWLTKLCRTDEWFTPLLAEPQTVIHGEFYAKTILVRNQSVFTVDWESAAIAAGQIDLAALTEGKHWPAEVVRECERAYARTRWPEGAPPGFGRTLDATKIYLHFRWLGERPDWTIREKNLTRYDHLHASARTIGPTIESLAMATVVITAYDVVNYPQGGGHFWVYLQYVLGLRLLGHDVYWLEAFRAKGREDLEATALATFQARMQKYGLGGKCILYRTRSKEPLSEAPAEYLNMTRGEAEAIFEHADLLLNFHYGISSALMPHFQRTALVDIDPGLLQFWITRAQLRVPDHDFYFTIGEGVGRYGGKIPNAGSRWIQIQPAVCLERWPYAFDPCSEAFTTVSTWDSSDWVVDRDETYENTKRVAFLEFAGLPRLTRQPLELALVLRTDRDMQERKNLENCGWRIRQACEVASTPEMYQAYIQRSRGEFSCAKPSYIKLQTSWISDRTLCYLASGKPVVVQHTGPSSFLPNGEGMFRFSTVQQASEAFDAINADYERHCRAARKLAETYFDAKQVVAKILSHALMDDESDRKGLESSRLPSWTARHPFSAIKKSTTPND